MIKKKCGSDNGVRIFDKVGFITVNLKMVMPLLRIIILKGALKK